MRIRVIEKKDNLAVKKLIQEALESLDLALPGTAYFDPQLSQLTEHYAMLEASNYWVIEDQQGKIVAGAGYGPFKKEQGICELQKLYVAKRAQGQGLSHLLMAEILAEAKKDYDQVYLETCEKLKVANHLYQKYDFQLLDQPLAGSDHHLMNRWYLKKL